MQWPDEGVKRRTIKYPFFKTDEEDAEYQSLIMNLSQMEHKIQHKIKMVQICKEIAMGGVLDEIKKGEMFYVYTPPSREIKSLLIFKE